MDSVDFTNILKIISPLSISVKENIEKFIDKNDANKRNEIEKFYNTINTTSSSPSTLSTTSNKSNNITKENNKIAYKETTRDKILRIVYDILNILLGLWAASISWKVNTIGQWSIIIKIIFAITAFFLAPLYLLLHFLFRYECLSKLDISNTSVPNIDNKSRSNSSLSEKKNTNTFASKVPEIPVRPIYNQPSINTKPPNSYISNSITKPINNSLNNSNNNSNNNANSKIY